MFLIYRTSHSLSTCNIQYQEEQKYLDGQGDIERQLYVKEKIEEIDRELLLKRGQHYVEIMYVAQGSITH